MTDLAFQIIDLYGDLVNSVNEDGLTPLHLLANKPSVFKSGGRLGRFEALVYYGKYQHVFHLSYLNFFNFKEMNNGCGSSFGLN